MDKQDIKAQKNGDTNVIVQSVEKNKESIGYFGYNFYKQNKDKLELELEFNLNIMRISIISL